VKTKLALKVIGLIGVLALISAGYCFWLMTVPLSYDWVPVVVIGFVLSTGVFVISLTLHLSSSYDCVDYLVHRMLRRSGRPSNQPAQPPVTYAKRKHQSG
jgi:hypothetical protein